MGILEIIREIEAKQGTLRGRQKDVVRGTVIERRLKAMCIDYYLDSGYLGIGPERLDVQNIVATVNPQRPLVYITSHYDAVPESPGANDNLSAVGVALNLAEILLVRPQKNIGVRFCFFDREENTSEAGGTVGSRVYVSSHPEISRGAIGVYNMEMVGFGDQLLAWGFNKQGLLMKTLEGQASLAGFPLHKVPQVVLQGSDHASFHQLGLESFSLTTATQKDLEFYQQFLAESKGKPRQEQEVLWHTIMRANAPFFIDYHEPTDVSGPLKEVTLRRVSNLLYGCVKSIDRAYASK
jgi:Zn-dependent M28 family amino/carboxypeptidase